LLGSSFSVRGVAETWLNGYIADADISRDGYKLHHKDRSCVKPGKAGCVVLHISKEIVSWEYEALNETKTESLWCKIATDSNRLDELVVGVCYKSPSAAECEVSKLFQVKEKAANSKVLVMGDFNFHGINWNTYDSDKVLFDGARINHRNRQTLFHDVVFIDRFNH
jgi:Endonuclease-reverse transcriptase